MIVLDTNVLSETLRPAPDALALTWLAQQPRSALFTTTVTRAELLYGVRLLPDGQRKAALMEAIHGIFASDDGRTGAGPSTMTHPMPTPKSQRHANWRARPISQFDAMIAAIAKSRGASLATRNVKDFVDCGITVIDPWKR